MILRTILIGAGATLFMDMVAVLRKKFFGVPSADYGLVGRWIGYMSSGIFFHNPIGASPAIKAERVIGWAAHYIIGILFAGILLVLFGEAWALQPILLPALVVGGLSVAAPFLVMQPGMGMGLAASRTPNPRAARMRSLLAHLIFGIGLFVAGWAVRFLGV